MALKIEFSAKEGQFTKAFDGIYYDLELAGQAAIEEAGAMALTGGRSSIAAAGFNSRWQKALRLKVYPPDGGGRAPSLNAKASIYHKIPYADVFETSTAIRGKPIMYLPLPTIDGIKLGARKPVTPARLIHTYGLRLAKVRSKRGQPLLTAPVAVPIGQTPTRVTLADLQRGKNANRQNLKAARMRKFSVPLFVGIDVIQTRKKFQVTEAVESARGKLASLFLQNLKVD